MYSYARLLSGSVITINSDFPLICNNQVDYQLDGYPFFLNYEKWHISLIDGAFVDQQETRTVTMPIVCAPLAIEISDLENDVGELDSLLDEEFSIMIKVNDDGVITALMMQDKIYFGSGFKDDDDWKPIMHYFPSLLTRHAMYYVPIALFNTIDDGKLFLYFRRSDNNVLQVKYCDLVTGECDFYIHSAWNEFATDFTYVTDIEMSIFNQCQAQRDQFLESSAYGLLAYVTR